MKNFSRMFFLCNHYQCIIIGAINPPLSLYVALAEGNQKRYSNNMVASGVLYGYAIEPCCRPSRKPEGAMVSICADVSMNKLSTTQSQQNARPRSITGSSGAVA